MHKLNIVALTAMLLFCGGVAGGDWDVWTTTETRRMLRDAPAEKSTAVDLCAARNEWRSFQILMRSDQVIKGINVLAADLSGPDGAVLKASDTRLYRQHQFHIETPSYRHAEFNAKPGWYPDALIPALHPASKEPLRGARFQAVPFDLPGAETDGFWLDIYIPSRAKPGLYRGTYRVTADGQRAIELPIQVTVWDFELPARPSLRTAFGSPASGVRRHYRQRAEGAAKALQVDWRGVEDQCNQLMSEHRLNATPGAHLTPWAQSMDPFHLSDEQISKLREFIDRYHVNAVEVMRLDRRLTPKDFDRLKKLPAWLASFDRVARQLDRPQVVFYIYVYDEPHDAAAYQYAREYGRVIRNAKSTVKAMVAGGGPRVFSELPGSIDIWCPFFAEGQEAAAKRRALGEMVWTYTALCQNKRTPWWQTDFPLLNYRVPAWILSRAGMTGLLYWGDMTVWRHAGDPWTVPQTYRAKSSKSTFVYNGEGSLCYPGRDVGYDGIAPSMRLKALRDSVQDYEYLATAERFGLAAEVEQIVRPLAESWFVWNPDPAAYDVARAKLAHLIVEAKRRGDAHALRRSPSQR